MSMLLSEVHACRFRHLLLNLIGISEGWGPSLEKIDMPALSFAACPKLNIIDIS